MPVAIDKRPSMNASVACPRLMPLMGDQMQVASVQSPNSMSGVQRTRTDITRVWVCVRRTIQQNTARAPARETPFATASISIFPKLNVGCPGLLRHTSDRNQQTTMKEPRYGDFSSTGTVRL